jgi:hypothetical protein
MSIKYFVDLIYRYSIKLSKLSHERINAPYSNFYADMRITCKFMVFAHSEKN